MEYSSSSRGRPVQTTSVLLQCFLWKQGKVRRIGDIRRILKRHLEKQINEETGQSNSQILKRVSTCEFYSDTDVWERHRSYVTFLYKSEILLNTLHLKVPEGKCDGCYTKLMWKFLRSGTYCRMANASCKAFTNFNVDSLQSQARERHLSLEGQDYCAGFLTR